MQHRHELGTIERSGTGATVRLERDFASPADELWRLLTDPAELAHWLCADVELELRAGGAIILRFRNTDTTVRGRVVRCDPPAVLEYTWGMAGEPESLVRFELRPDPVTGTTRLTLTHTGCANAEAAEMAAGWHHHLELLATRLAGEPVAWDWSRFAELHAGYGAPAARYA